MTQSFRTAGGLALDRMLDNVAYGGFAGDTLASALLANGVRPSVTEAIERERGCERMRLARRKPRLRRPARAVNLAEKLKLFDDHWAPRVVGSFNGHDLILVKVRGRFVWHSRRDFGAR
jgi:hypothetical protein